MSHWSLDACFLVRFFPTFTRKGPWLLRVPFCEGHRSFQLAGQHTFGTHCTAGASRGGLWRNLSLGVDSWKNDGFWGQFLWAAKADVLRPLARVLQIGNPISSHGF